MFYKINKSKSSKAKFRFYPSIQKALMFSKIVFLDLLDPPLLVFLIVIITKVLDLSHDYVSES